MWPPFQLPTFVDQISPFPELNLGMVLVLLDAVGQDDEQQEEEDPDLEHGAANRLLQVRIQLRL